MRRQFTRPHIDYHVRHTAVMATIIRELAHAWPRFRYLRIWVLLRREGLAREERSPPDK